MGEESKNENSVNTDQLVAAGWKMIRESQHEVNFVLREMHIFYLKFL